VLNYEVIHKSQAWEFLESINEQLLEM